VLREVARDLRVDDRATTSPISRPVQRIGRTVSHALVGGLHHQYARI
jgi:hypothetical protein